MDTVRKRKLSGEEKETSSTAVKMETNILDVNSDCLEAVFMHLNVMDLVNIATVMGRNDRFNVVLDSIFKKKFSQSLIAISNVFNHATYKFIKLLNRFGTMITKLEFDFRLASFKPMYDAVAKNCKDKITELKLTYGISDGYHRVDTNWFCTAARSDDLIAVRMFFRKLASQFPQLERLSICRDGSEFSPGIESWHTIAMPSLTHFAYSDIDTQFAMMHTITDENFDDIADGSTYKNVDAYVDGYCENDREIRFNFKMLKAFLVLNPQLSSLSLQMDKIPKGFISFLDSRLPNLSCLKITSDLFDGFDGSCVPKGTNHLRNLTKLKFQVNSSKNIPQFGFLGKHLHYLKVQERDFIAAKLVRVASRFTELKKIKLIVPNRLFYGGDGDVYDRDISMDGLKNLPSHCRHLDEIVIKFEMCREMEHFIKEFKEFGSWKVFIFKEKRKIVLNKA